MNDTLAVDDGIHLPQRQAVEPHGLDDLKALVHQRRGIDGDLRAHRPVGVTERVSARLARKLLTGKTIERSARAGQDQSFDLAAVTAALHTLKNCAVLAVHRHDLRAELLRRVHHERARAHQRLLVGQRDALALFDGGKRGLQTDHADHGGHHCVGVLRRRGGKQTLHTGEHLRFRVPQALAQFGSRRFVIKHGKTRAKLPRLLFDEINARIGGQRRDGQSQLPCDLQRLAAD